MPPVQQSIGSPPATLRAFLHGIIDYAGLFPPAGLSLPEAITNYAAFRESREAWMLARFVIPVDRLGELSGHGELFHRAPPFRFSVLGSGGASEAMFLEHLVEDIAAMSDFEMRHPGRVICDAMEVRVPPSVRSSGDAAPLIRNAVALLREHNRSDFQLFLEVPWTDEHADIVRQVAAAAADTNDSGRPLVGLKIRTGGVETHMFPEPVDVARFITTSHREGAPFKATAGLHHPIRRFHSSVDTYMHGFVNVFGAAVLLHAGRILPDEVERVIEDEEATSFAFTRDAFRWRDRSVSADEVATGREFATSFGSCSFDEPREDLRLLNIL